MSDESLQKFRESWLNEINCKVKISDQNTNEVSETEGKDRPSLQKLEHEENTVGLTEDCKKCKVLQSSKEFKKEFNDPHLNIALCNVVKTSSYDGDIKKTTRRSCLSLKSDQNGAVNGGDKISASDEQNSSSNKVFNQPDIKKFKPESQNKDLHEDLLQILITDINETVSLPFFDLELPKEIAVKIFRYLDIKDLGNCAIVSKQWKTLAEDDLIWFDVCVKYGFETKCCCILDKHGWKFIVRDYILQEKQFRKNWKQRICQISELEYEKGGILYAASIFKDKAISGYANGIVKIWDIFTERPIASLGTAHNESDTTDDNNLVECVCMNDFMCTAGYSNGQVHVWQNGNDFPLVHRYQAESKINCLAVGDNSTSVISSSGCNLRIDFANDNGIWQNPYLAKAEKHINSVYLYDAVNYKAIISTKDTVEVHEANGKLLELEKAICAEISCLYCTKEIVSVCVTPLSYSILDGYRIKQYCIEKGNFKHVFKGPHCRTSCVQASDNFPSMLAVGCSDKKIRIHNSDQENVVMQLSGLLGIPCSLQIDDWKVIAGDLNGVVSVWDQRTKALLWQTRTRHPVRTCQLSGPCLVTASLPLDKNPRATLWYADDLIQHRRYRGNIRVYNFSAVNDTTGVPEICQSDYVALSGYNFNINLSTPYDHL